MRIHTIIYSYLFFALFVFNGLALLSSEFIPVFAQVFILLAENGHVYDIFSFILLLATLFSLYIVVFRFYKQRDIMGRTALFIITCVACILFCALCFLLTTLYGAIFEKEVFIVMAHPDKTIQTLESYIFSSDFVISFLCWLLLVILPLTYKALSVTINIKHRIGKGMLVLEPSITTILIVMSASACYPYFSAMPSRFVYFVFFAIACILLFYVLLRQKATFGFYDYMNIVLFVLGVFCFILCSQSMLRSDFFNTQLTLYILGISSWCNEWLHNQKIMHEQMAL